MNYRGTEARRPIDRITHREWHVIACIMRGMRNRAIGAALDPPVAEQTVKNYVRSILDKIGRDSRLELAVWAFEHRKAA